MAAPAKLELLPPNIESDDRMTVYHPTGNEYIALPTLRESDAAIETASVVLAKVDGLVELEGPEGRPFLQCEAGERNAGYWEWDFIEDWIPVFRHEADPASEGFVCAPPDQRFFAYRAPVRRGPARFTLNLGHIYQTINVRQPLPSWICRVQSFNWSWSPGVVIDIFAGTLLFSLALRCPGETTFRYVAGGNRHAVEPDGEAFETSGPFALEVETVGEPVLMVGFGMSRVGARSADIEACSRPLASWVERTSTWLAERRVSVASDEELSRKANRNGHFARFYAMARTLDSSETVSMTSRSHRYYVSAAYWDRDSLLWLYPFLVRNDREHARQLLGYAFGPQLQHAGIHSRQIGGQVLEYGFELDELCAPLLALGQWHRLHPDMSLWETPFFRDGAIELLGRLHARRCSDVALYRTELMPTDDPIVGGRDILTYNNALVLRTLRLLLPFAETHVPSLVRWIRQDIESIPSAIARHLVHDGIYAWATDRNESWEFYDEAAGSLMLLSHLGLCERADPVFRATVDRLYSKEYPYRLEGSFSELGNRHTAGLPHPWVLSACNAILSGVRADEGLDFLRRAPMDGGIACESVNVETGLPESGMHFATCAGFVAHAIAYGAGGYEPNSHERDQRPRAQLTQVS